MKSFRNERLIEALRRSRSVFLCTHIAPDGDAIGSLLAMKQLLEDMGKTVTACCADPVPLALQPLNGAQQVVLPAGVVGDFDTALSLDAADLRRIGACADIYQRAPVRLQLDHHGTNPGFAQENEIDPAAAATGCIVMRLVEAMRLPLTQETAACLYAAISTDTGNFCFSNADAEVFEIMARLVATGFDLSFWARQLQLLREKGHLGLLSRALSRLTWLHGGKATVTTILPQDYADVGALPEHSENIVNYGLYIPGVSMTCFVNGRDAETTKLSFRALPPYSAQRAALRLGGGGHEAAAGATLRLPVEQAMPLVLEAIRREMEITQ